MRARLIGWAVAIVILVALPPVLQALGQPFYIDLTRRIMILAIAAVSLNLILGYGGMVSFGHAAYIGIGAYAVGILGFYGFFNGWLHLAVAMLASALVALAIGAVSIRTSGIYFIMITLAFTQMLYYLGISVAVLRATKSNEARSRAIGFSPYPYRLAAFVIAGAMGGLAGALYGNHTNYITPSLMTWEQSGDLMFMVILGGMATTAGPVIGAFAFLFGEEIIKALLGLKSQNWIEHWQVLMGPALILCVIFFRRGLAGIFYKPDA